MIDFQAFAESEKGTALRRLEKSASQLKVLRCAGAHYDFREVRKRPKSGQFASNQRKIL
jgi:hypothetical protein